MAENDALRRVSELERSLTARLAEQEEQLRALRRSTLPDNPVAVVAAKAARKAKRAPASARRRTRAAQRRWRLARERPQVADAERLRRDEVVDRYLDAQTSMPRRGA